MSYTQIEILGKTRGVKFNMYAIEVLGKHLNGDSAAAFSYAAVYAGLCGNCYVKREEPDFSFEQVCDAVDELGTDALDAVGKALNESKAWQAAVEKGKELEEDKKKATQNSVEIIYGSHVVS